MVAGEEATDPEEERLDALCESLFSLFLRFQNAFARAAIDKMGLTDADAEGIARMMEAGGSKIGHAFAYLMRNVISERLLRSVSHDPATGWSDARSPEKGVN